MFSSVFPLAALMSIISNGIQVKSQIKNLKYQRRFKAESSNGIGSWLDHLDNLCRVGIVNVSLGVYLTSSIYQNMFVTAEPHEEG